MVMLMMCVMNMKMIMLQSFVNVLVVVPFCQMEIEPQGHQHTGRQELQRQRLVQEDDSQQRTDERRQRKIGPGPGGAEMA